MCPKKSVWEKLRDISVCVCLKIKNISVCMWCVQLKYHSLGLITFKNNKVITFIFTCCVFLQIQNIVLNINDSSINPNLIQVTWIDCWVDAGVIKGTSNLTPSAWTKDDLTTGSFSKVDRQLTEIGMPRLGWEGLFSCGWHIFHMIKTKFRT